jgi:death on curing protein
VIDRLVFLTVEQVLALHRHGVQEHGGSSEVRDLGLVESAVESVRQTFSGELLHRSVEEVAAAYWFGLTINHPFVDGNKRVGLRAADTFLILNGYELGCQPDEAAEMGLEIARGNTTKEQVVEFIRRHMIKLDG